MTVAIGAHGRTRSRLHWNRTYIPLTLAVVLFLVDVVQGGGTVSSFQVLGIANNALPLALVAVGETLVILTNGIDLSVGSVVGLANAILAVTHHGNGLLGMVVALAAGCLVGLINGVIVSYGRMASLIVTLATGSVCAGVALFVLPTPGGAAPSWLANLTVGSIGSLPVAVIWLCALGAGGWLLLRRTAFGVYLQCMGSSDQASWSNGVPTSRVRLGAYTGAGFFSALAGATLSGLTGSGDPNIGTVYVLTAIAAVVVGGTQLVGGVGTITGSVLGAVVLCLVSAVLFASGLSSNLQYVVTGAIVIGALVVHSLGHRRTDGHVLRVRRRPRGEVAP